MANENNTMRGGGTPQQGAPTYPRQASAQGASGASRTNAAGARRAGGAAGGGAAAERFAGAGAGGAGAGLGANAGAGKTAGGAAAGGPANRGKASRRTTLVVVAGVVIAALAVWLLVWLFACNGNSLLDATARDGQAPYKSEEEMQAELNRQVEEGMFNISIASVIQFDDGTSDGTAFIENVPGNRYNMQVTITDDATGDVLYESGILKPNQFIENIALAKDLEPGTYDATATFTAMDGNTYDEVGKAAAKVTISVLG